jgi:hypothetical protein
MGLEAAVVAGVPARLAVAPGQEPADDPRVLEIAAAAKALDDLRRTWLNPEGATEAELRKRTLTTLYNTRPTWLKPWPTIASTAPSGTPTAGRTIPRRRPRTSC